MSDDWDYIDTHYILSSGDVCVNCGLLIDKKIEKMFEKMLDRHTIESDADEYESDLAFCYNVLNKKHPCLTDEEYLIKKALE